MEIQKGFHGLVPCTHGNTKRVPHNALPVEVIQHVIDFIVSYAETHALPLPGRLPSHRSLFCCSESHFMYLWRKQLPYIHIMKPYTDLCDTSQQMQHTISLTANVSDEDKAGKLTEFSEHLQMAKAERKLYNEQCRICHEQLSENDSDSVQSMHYSFDYAQQVHYLSSPQQPGSLYFKTARKCVFGICCEPLSKQVTYLIDEACSTGKGADTVISFLHHFLEVHS